MKTISRLLTLVLVALIRAYQVLLAPHFVGGCRHIPSCSEYTIGVLRKHGLWHGARLASARLWSCRPGGSYGYDPVP